jgi:23S rRNA (adenine2503-C2)-methyltransferase
MTESLLGMDLPEIQQALGERAPRYRAIQLHQAIYQQRLRSIADISTLSKSARSELTERFSIGWPKLQQHFDSSDGTRRYLLTLDDGKTVETVHMPEGARSTICVSTQVGCPVDCKFCLTALMGLERNLSAGEIVGQILYVLEDQQLRGGEDRVNIVFMGMGEPLLNLANVLKATRILTHREGAALSPRRITLSTSGIIPRIHELGQVTERPKLAISLNASTDKSRRELMPITRKYTLAALLEACKAYPLRSWEKLTFEYVLLRDVNDSDADARRVVRLLSNLNCIVNLIALNPGPGIPFDTPLPERVESFQRIVQRAMPCFVRKPRGRDVYAACGQLKRMSSAEIISFPPAAGPVLADSPAGG